MAALKILTYNIQSGMGIDGVRDVTRIGRLVAGMGADIAGLQEVEMGSPRSRFVNQPARLSEASGMEYAFGHGFQRGPWRFGNCLLSRFPIRSSRRHALPSTGEPRSVLAAQVDWEGRVLHVLCTHLGLDREERIGQVREIRRILDGLDGPAILMGDLNDFPDSPPLVELLSGSGLMDVSGSDPTFPAPTPRAKIDYIFTRGLPASGTSVVLPSPFSDHLPVEVELVVIG